jgi:Tfp pilus assembly protein PilF
MATIARILATILTLLSLVCAGQQLDYKTWKEESRENIRLRPEYGNVPKSKDQKAADEEFIELSLKQDGTREKASQHMVDLGFKYLYSGDIRTAMYRFNQAWLLNPTNDNVYWGFGAVYFVFNDFESAVAQYKKGLSINPKSSNILTDVATIYLSRFTARGEKANLDSARNIFMRSYLISPKNQNTLFKLSATYFLDGDCARAVKYFDECEALGGKPITPQYRDALKQKCKR